MPQLRQRACREYLEGFEQIGGREDRLPDLKTSKLQTAAQDRLANRPRQRFSSSWRILRDAQRQNVFLRRHGCGVETQLESTPKADIFHDVFGHVPIKTHPIFRRLSATLRPDLRGINQPTRSLWSEWERVFWFTVEFGVIRQNGELKVYGSGLISSHGRCTRVLAGDATSESLTWML